jgi:halogenation protein CepH
MLTGLIDECPAIKEYLSGATRVTTGEYGKLRVRRDYSYFQTKFWRPGMVLVGDTACFVDPVFSSGVHLATYAGLLAARSINSVLANLMDEEVAFGEFEARYRREYGVFYEFLTAFYDMQSSEKSYFWQARKLTNSSHTELEAFVDLVGGVASGESALTDAETVAKRFHSRSAELASAVDELTTQVDEDMRPLFKSSAVRQVMQESRQIHTHAMLGDEAESDAPLFSGGLIPSSDGMFWAVPE